jgi:DNA-binding Xre family transcriptional regulator
MSELMRSRGIKTAYMVAQRSNGAISQNVAYRLVKADGRFQKFGEDLLDALCDLFDVGPGELLEYEGKSRRRARG